MLTHKNVYTSIHNIILYTEVHLNNMNYNVSFIVSVKNNLVFSLIGCIRLGAVWVCWYISLRALGQRLYHSCLCSCCSSPVKVHPWSLTEALQWTAVYCLCEYNQIHALDVHASMHTDVKY